MGRQILEPPREPRERGRRLLAGRRRALPGSRPHAGHRVAQRRFSTIEVALPWLGGRRVVMGFAARGQPLSDARPMLLTTPEDERAIASLDVGDLVYSIEGAAVVIVPILRIGRTLVQSHHQVVEAALANGAVLRISPRHPTADGRLFGDLVAGDHLGEIEVVRVGLVPYDGEYTYDVLPASKNGYYFAGGALVGSTIEGK
jgi:hypothetical protein